MAHLYTNQSTKQNILRLEHHQSDAVALQNPRPRPKDDNEAFVIYVNNGFNNSSMQPSASNNILGTSLESFEMTSSTGEVTISIS
jgi:hypothetical protein